MANAKPRGRRRISCPARLRRRLSGVPAGNLGHLWRAVGYFLRRARRNVAPRRVPAVRNDTGRSVGAGRGRAPAPRGTTTARVTACPAPNPTPRRYAARCSAGRRCTPARRICWRRSRTAGASSGASTSDPATLAARAERYCHAAVDDPRAMVQLGRRLWAGEEITAASALALGRSTSLVGIVASDFRAGGVCDTATPRRAPRRRGPSWAPRQRAA